MNLGDLFWHKYDKSRATYMGLGYLVDRIDNIYYLKFMKLKNISAYVRKSMYNLELYTDFFEE